MSSEPTITEQDLADIAALADRSLPPERAAAVRARVAASAELSAELARQERATGAIAAAQRQVRAPAELRARVGAERTRRRPLWSARRLGFATGGIAIAAAALILALLVIPSGVTGEKLIAEAAATHAEPVQGPAPQERAPTLLDYDRFGVTFPAWRTKFQWEAVGVRRDRVEGRDVETVGYRKDGKTVGYSVISGDTVSPPDSAREATVEGNRLRVFKDGSRTIVVFVRGKRTCVVSAVGVPEDTLARLAGWKGAGTVKF